MAAPFTEGHLREILWFQSRLGPRYLPPGQDTFHQGTHARLYAVASPMAKGRGVLEVGCCLVRVANGLAEESQHSVNRQVS